MKKSVLSIAAAGMFLFSVSGLLAGNFAGGDDFTGDAIDTTKWNPDILPGWGHFTQLDGQIKIDSDGGGSCQGALP